MNEKSKIHTPLNLLIIPNLIRYKNNIQTIHLKNNKLDYKKELTTCLEYIFMCMFKYNNAYQAIK